MLKPQVRRVLALAAIVSFMVMQGCSSLTGSADRYSGSQAQREQTIRLATVQTVRDVTIAGGDSGGILGSLGGGALGAVAGSAIGGGRGSLLTGIVGGLAGAIAGNKVEGKVRTAKGLEITVRLDNGEMRAITQNASGETFKAGDRVRLLTSGGVTRVTH